MIRGALALAAGVALVALVVFCLWLVKLYRIPSSAMEPTLHCARPAFGCAAGTSDRVLAVRLVGPFRHVDRGDIVFFRTPRMAVERCGAGGVYAKRVVGLPGEAWAERHGTIAVDGRPLREPYVQHRDTESFAPRRIPAGSYLLLGDNRAASCDSRVFGPVPRGRLIAKLEAVYWPPGRVGFR